VPKQEDRAPDEIETPPRAIHTGDLETVRPPRTGLFKRHWGKLTLATLVLAPVAVFAIWSAVALSYTYSSGDRTGFVQKISKKGWVCKTWEGELAMSPVPGAVPQLFEFTVRSDSLAAMINQTSGKRVALHYEEHTGLPSSCFGDTRYFVTGLRVVE
jgi:hypothetical protein